MLRNHVGLHRLSLTALALAWLGMPVTSVWAVPDNRIGSVSVAAQSPATLVAGLAGTATYEVTINRANGVNGGITAHLSVTTVLPTDAVAEFEGNDIVFGGNELSKSVNLFIHTADTTPAGMTAFTVLVENTQLVGDDQSNGGALTVVPCAADGDCDDLDPCTTDTCQAGVCAHDTDDDDDGVPNCNDLCAATPNGEAVNADGCACSQLNCDDGDPCTTDSCDAGVCAHALVDADADGVCDLTDNCPQAANADQLDNDADGIGNACDATPDGEPAPQPTPDVCGLCAPGGAGAMSLLASLLMIGRTRRSFTIGSGRRRSN